MIHIKRFNSLLLTVLLLLISQGLWLGLAMKSALAIGNIHITGLLISEPCTVLPESANIEVNFGALNDRDLYRLNRIEQPFQINLTDCDNAMAKTISIAFMGNASSQQTGLLAIDSQSQASGVSIGIESDGGQLIAINEKNGPTYPIINKDNTLIFKAFLQADPTAISQKTIGLGSFSATATFLLQYN
ncbi:fimbrial protein [Utexia brackfieldae]|uniref:fimbrial protein n=1 Tax=Utexia brackfieldae TaxID=3074108 RepID=UPI00370D1A18